MLGLLFIASAVPKIQNPFIFLDAVYAYKLTSPRMSMLVAMILPWIELVIGSCLLGNVVIRAALLLVLTSALLCASVISSALYRDLGMSCGCFGYSSNAPRLGILDLGKSLLIGLVAFATFVLGVMLRQPIPPKERHVEVADAGGL